MTFFYISTLTFFLFSSVLNVEGEGSIKPDPNADPVADAKELLAVFKDQAKFRSKVVEMFPKRDREKRIQINNEFAKMNKAEPFLPDDYEPCHPMGCYCSNPYNDLFFSLIHKMDDVYISFLDYLCVGENDEYKKILAELLIALDARRLDIITKWERRTKRKFSKHIKWIFGDFKNLLKEMKKYQPDPDVQKIDDNLVNEDAQKLFDEQKHWENNRKVLDRLALKEPRNHVRKVFEAFKNKNGGYDLIAAIDYHLSKDIMKYTYKALYDHILDPEAHICNLVKNNPFGHDYTTLAVLLSDHSDTDLGDIKKKYKERNNSCMKDDILKIGGNQEVIDLLAAIVGDC